MNINELGEDLEQQFGKPRNITEENVRFMLSLIKEEFDGTKVNENIEKPSLEAFGMTILAVMSYQTTPWEELAKKPSIRKTLKYIAIRGNDHYDEMEALTKELIRKHFDGITQKMVLGFLKIIRGVSNEERPTKLIEYTPFAAQYYAIQYASPEVRGSPAMMYPSERICSVKRSTSSRLGKVKARCVSPRRFSSIGVFCTSVRLINSREGPSPKEMK